MGEKMFKSALNGFNKQEVLDYVNSLTSEHNATKDELNRLITELEEKIAEQFNSINDKNDQIAKLMEELESAQKKSGNNFNLLSDMNVKYDQLKAELSKKETDYENQIKSLNEQIDAMKESNNNEVSALKEEYDAIVESVEQNIKEKTELEERLASLEEQHKNSMAEYEIQVHSQKNDYESKIAQLTREHLLQIDELKNLNQDRMTSLNNEYNLKISQLESENRKAIEIARAGAVEIKASLDSARAVEEDAKRRADELIQEAQLQCEQMKQNAEEEIAALKEQEMNAIENEIDIRKNETYSMLVNISENLEHSRTQFNREFDALTRSLRENI